jgi:hypothetical protein
MAPSCLTVYEDLADEHQGETMKAMNCPCGSQITGETDEAFVAAVNEHLSTAHPEMGAKYTDEQILSRAQEV